MRKKSSHALTKVGKSFAGQTILAFNEPDHDEHPLTPGNFFLLLLIITLLIVIIILIISEKAVDGWLQLEETYYDRFSFKALSSSAYPISIISLPIYNLIIIILTNTNHHRHPHHTYPHHPHENKCSTQNPGQPCHLPQARWRDGLA